MPNRRISDVIKGHKFIHVLPDTSIRDAARTMAEEHIGAVAILEGGKLLGIFTERDLITRVVAVSADPDTTAIADVMSEKVLTVDEHDKVRKALGLMKLNNLRHLIVTKNDIPSGMVSIRDFVGKELDELDQQAEMEERLWEVTG